jgi:hypothetical protein
MDIMPYLIVFLAGLGSGYTLKFVVDASRKKKISVASSPNAQGEVMQNRNTVGGSMAGRDINAK